MNPAGKLNDIIPAYFHAEEKIIVEPVSEGLTNFNYILKNRPGKKFFLKVFRNANTERVASIVQLSGLLKKFHFPTAAVIPLLNGDLFWSDGHQSAFLTEYIEGRYPEKSKRDLYQIGSVLGALHQIPAGIPLIHGYSLNYAGQLEKLSQAGATVEEDLQIFLEKTAGVIQSLDRVSFPESIIHGDVFLDNLLVSEFGDIFFVDFEGGCIEKSIFDLSRAVIGCAIVHHRIDLALAASLVQGYDMSRTLLDVERDYMYEYVIYSGVVSTLWRYNEFYVQRNSENRKYIYRLLMNPVMDLLNTGKDRFMECVFRHPEEVS